MGTGIDESYDVVVVGAGIIGAAVAYELSRKGRRTLSVDMLPAAGSGPTSNSCAIIRLHYSTLDGCAMAYDAYHDWADWPGYLGASHGELLAEFHDCGVLVMKTVINDGLCKQLAHLDVLGIAYEHWTNEMILDQFPLYDLSCFGPARGLDDPAFGEPTGGEVNGAVFFPQGGYISDPRLATENIQKAAERLGAKFRFNSRVVEVLASASRVEGVGLDDGTTVGAPVVVNVAGPHSSQVNALARANADMRISTRALRQEVVHLPAPSGVDYSSIGCVVSDSDISVYTRPEVGNNILAGSEDPPCDDYLFVDPDNYDTGFSDQWAVQAQRLGQRIPDLGIPNVRQGCVDLYDVTEDWIPIYDRSCLAGFYMACGSSGNQFKNASTAGRMMVALIEHCEAGNDHDSDPMGYRLEHVNHEISLGTFSRLRDINPDSTFSVLG